ncbi:hypothetical protein Pyn_32035 [Prunus yedoensis var. nudiflora]|uniref:Uncharacterized protein n=1 Tax=Prunus yedoensis var. nudiflora TaxID=2094558 RepID=A0A314XMJ8_PRUYE|nr:hypothetical protein Pyn_32035 [Prunus yedoensis var. nudiflora]
MKQVAPSFGHQPDSPLLAESQTSDSLIPPSWKDYFRGDHDNDTYYALDYFQQIPLPILQFVVNRSNLKLCLFKQNLGLLKLVCLGDQ